MSVQRRLAACAAGLACAAAAAPAVAEGATLTNANGVLTYTAAPGAESAVEFSKSTTPGDNTITVNRFGDNDAITPDGCTANSSISFTCLDVTSLARRHR